MHISPVLEQDASEEIKSQYEKIKQAFGTTHVPVFFTYIGAFPQYLSYITNQVTESLFDTRFLLIESELHRNFSLYTEKTLSKSQDTQKWLNRYKQTPDFFNFQNDLKEICRTNIKLTCIFIGLREAVKGWAVAARKLKEGYFDKYQKTVAKVLKKEDFVFNQEFEFVLDRKYLRTPEMSQKEKSQIEVSLLPQFMTLCRNDFQHLSKLEEFLMLRVQFEKNILRVLSTLPNLIYSPYNMIVKLIGKEENFYDLLYLLSENFPTLSMQRLMFSEFMVSI